MSSPDETPGKLNVLVAYPYATASVLDQMRGRTDVRFVLDSGAFTAWKAGKPISLDDYCRFIEKLPIKPWRYFTLDVIGDPHASMANYESMLKRGFNPVPIFTRGEDPSVLEDYYKTSDVVGIGGLVGTKGNKGFVNGIMRHVKGRRVHWLGFTNMDFIKQWRPYMCDSSSWSSGARFASHMLYMGNAQFITFKKKDFAKRPDIRIVNRIAALGFNPYAFCKEEAWGGSTRTLSRQLGAASNVALVRDVETYTGTKMFLAVCLQPEMEFLLKHYDLQQERKAAA